MVDSWTKVGVLAAVVGTAATVLALFGFNSSSPTSGTSNGSPNGSVSQPLPTPPISSFHTYQPRLSLDPSSGPAGTSVTAKGTGFASDSLVQVFFSGGLVGQGTSDENGSVTISFMVPSEFSNFAGTQITVSASDSQADNADQLFTVT